MHNKNLLLGSWKLISAEYKSTERIGYPFGTNPEGFLIYDAYGWMTVQIMHRDYAKGLPPSAKPSEKNRASFNGYLGYFGTYEIDEAHSIVSHRVAGSTLPHWIGSLQQRTFEFTDEKLILSTPATAADSEVIATLVWVRTA